MDNVIRPTEPTPFAKWIGIEKLGDFNPENNTYVVSVTPPPEALNFFPTLHGGYPPGVFDDAFGMLTYFIYGVNSATTIKGCVIPRKMVRPGSDNCLTFEVSLVAERHGVLYLKGVAKKGGTIISEATSLWRLRKNRGEK